MKTVPVAISMGCELFCQSKAGVTHAQCTSRNRHGFKSILQWHPSEEVVRLEGVAGTTTARLEFLLNYVAMVWSYERNLA